MLLRTLAGPLIGSVIGYFTNFIAVKMLFYPRKEVYLFGHKLPFTPGAIPKGKDRLARAVGNAVSDMLLTKEDIEQKLLSPEVVEGIAGTLTEKLSEPLKTSIRNAGNLSEYDYIIRREKVCQALTMGITGTLAEMDLTEILTEKGIEMVHENLTNPMLMMFITDDLLRSILSPMGPKIQEMIRTEGPAVIEPILTEKIRELEKQPALDLLEQMNIQEEAVRRTLVSVIGQMLKGSISKIVDMMDIRKIVETKISEMSVEELEVLVLTVMKKELNTIVNLGALIGFILGLVNLLI